MTKAKPMTREELAAWDRMFDDPTVVIPVCNCGRCGKCTLLSMLMCIPRVRATLADREARLRRAVEAFNKIQSSVTAWYEAGVISIYAPEAIASIIKPWLTKNADLLKGESP